MAYQVIRQPDGQLAVFSTYTDAWVVYDADEDEVLEFFATQAYRDAWQATMRITSAVLRGKPHEAYGRRAMTFSRANEKSEDSGGIVLPATGGDQA